MLWWTCWLHAAVETTESELLWRGIGITGSGRLLTTHVGCMGLEMDCWQLHAVEEWSLSCCSCAMHAANILTQLTIEKISWTWAVYRQGHVIGGRVDSLTRHASVQHLNHSSVMTRGHAFPFRHCFSSCTGMVRYTGSKARPLGSTQSHAHRFNEDKKNDIVV